MKMKRQRKSKGSNINEIIKTVLNFLSFHDKILHAQKAPKEYKVPKKSKSTKT